MTFERRSAEVSGGTLSYQEAGEGKPVLFVHGIPSSGHLFRNAAALLAPIARVVVVDMLGYGASQKPADADLTVRAQARYLGELCDALGLEEPAAVGHDLGTAVALLLALEGRLGAAVLTNGASFDSWPIEGVRLLGEMPEDRWDAEMAENVVRIAFEQGMTRDLAPGDLEEYLRPWRDDPRALGRAFRAVDGVGLEDSEERLGKLEIPVFVLWGEEDPYQPPEWAERLGGSIPTSTTALLPGVSHFLFEDAPETVGPLVAQWLRTVFLGMPRHAPQDTIAPEDLGISFERPEGPPDDLPDE